MHGIFMNVETSYTIYGLVSEYNLEFFKASQGKKRNDRQMACTASMTASVTNQRFVGQQ